MAHYQDPQSKTQSDLHQSQLSRPALSSDYASSSSYQTQLRDIVVTPGPEELTKYSNEDAEALFSNFRSPPSGGIQPLAMPLCLPQATSGPTSLFVRAYSRELQASGIEIDDWMRFVDGLNLAMTASPPLRVVDVAGMAIGFVPYHWAMIASIAIQTAAQTGIRVIAKTLSDRLLRRANADYFAPRGLRVRLCKTAAMRQIVGLDTMSTAEPKLSGKLAKFGKGVGRTAETVALHLPIIREAYNRVAPSVPAVDPSSSGEVAMRRMLVLQGYTLPLSFDVPPAAPVEGIMDKASGLSVRMQAWRLRRKEADTNRKRQLLAFQEGRSATPPPMPSSSSSGNRNLLEVALDWRKDRIWQLQELRAGIAGRSSGKLRTNVEIADRLEWNSTDNLLWVVLVNADQDAEIQGTELVDSAEDVETIRDSEWQQEIRRENEEDQYTMEKILKFGKTA
ncbi:hypothetical protein M0805_004476 [Coniferiporia weirii]|nr:hypothetical protein M0805_004476 [Coniferiporia weirii]